MPVEAQTQTEQPTTDEGGNLPGGFFLLAVGVIGLLILIGVSRLAKKADRFRGIFGG